MTVIGEALVQIVPVAAGFGQAAAKQIKSEADIATKQSAGVFDGIANIGKTAFLGITAGALALGAVSLKLGGDFQQSMRLLVTGAGEAQGNIAMVSKSILDMAGQVGFMPEQLAKGMYMIESAGYHGAAGLTVLRAAAEGAKADGAALDVVGNALTTVMTDLHAPASKAADIMSQMVVAVGLGKMRMDDLAGSIHNVLPAAAAAHLSFAEVGGAIATMTAEGMSADQVTQNLNHTIVKLQAPTVSMQQAMASYGLNAQQVSLQLGQKGLSGTLNEVYTAIMDHMGPAGLTLRSAFNQSQSAAADAKREMANLPPAIQGIAQAFAAGTITQAAWRKDLKDLPVDQRNLATAFANSENKARGFSAALKSGGQDSQTFTAALQSVLGDQTGLQVALHLTGENMATYQANIAKIGSASADSSGHVRDWSVVQKGFNQQISQAEAAVVSFATQMGILLIPYVERAIAVVKTIVQWLTQHKDVALALAGVIAGALATAVGVYFVQSAMKFGTAIAHIGQVALELIGKLAGVAFTEDALAASSAAAAGGFDAMAVAATILDAVPIVALVVGIAVAVAALIVGIYELVTHWHQVWTDIKQWIEDAWQFIESHVHLIAAGLIILLGPIGLIIAAAIEVGAHWKAIWGAVTDAASAAWSFLGPIFSTIASAVRDGVGTAFTVMGTVVRDVWHALQTAAAVAWEILRPILSVIITIIRDDFIVTFIVLRAIVEAVWVAIRTAITVAWDLIRPIFDAIVQVIKIVLIVAWDILRVAVEVAWALIRIAIAVAWILIQGIFNLIVGFIRDVLAPIFTWLWQNVIVPTWQAIGTIIRVTWEDVIRPILDAAVAFFQTVLAPAFTWLWHNVVSPVWDGIKEAIRVAWELIRPILQGIIDFVGGVFTGAFNTLRTVMSSIWDGIKNDAQAAWNLIVGVVKGAANLLIDGLNAIVAGINLIGSLPGINVKISPVKRLAEGGGLAEGGFKTDGPRFLVGEGNQAYPEYVIATDPAYRTRNVGLMRAAASDMGIGQYDLGGVLGGIAKTVAGAIVPGAALIPAAANSGIPGVSDVASLIGKLTSGAADSVLSGLFSLFDKALGAIGVPFISAVGHGMEDEIRKWVHALIGGLTASSGGGSPVGAIPTGAHAALIAQALALAGQPLSPANEAAVNDIVNFESGWNPNAINLTDSNAKAGHPSQGLMQTIPSTFHAYALPAYSGNINDPLSNLIAGIRYAVARYGSLENTPGEVSRAHGGPYRGYDAGGILPPGLTMAYNGTGRNERVISPSGAGGGGVNVAAGAVQIVVQAGATIDPASLGGLQVVVEEAISEAFERIDAKLTGANPGGH
ncbi:MAG: phage tail tape measure protein [Acidimicrobiales bacterium]